MGDSGEDNKIARIDTPTTEDFRRNFISRSKPVIIEGATENWKALSSWTDDYLKSVIGATKVRVEVSSNNYFPSLQDGPKTERQYRQISFADYVGFISSENTRADKYYLSDSSLFEKFPILAADIGYPAFLDKRLTLRNSWWFGAAGTITPLHYDLVYNLIVQVRGRKRFTLFAPKQLKLLYPMAKSSRRAHFSRVNIERPDLAAFPKFRQTVRLEFTLEAGEMLFIPPFWWHQVQSLERAISLNFWWKISWREYLKRPALRLSYSLLRDLAQGFHRRKSYARERIQEREVV